jgi:hypothetical protein
MSARGGLSLSAANPRIAAQWHPTRNGGITAEDVLSGSHARAWWLCETGHEWEAIIANRTKGRGCPHCDGRVVGYGNSLADLNPKLASQWHVERNDPLLPSQVRPGSNKKVWWRCAQGHEWDATVGSRSAGSGCPYCTGQRAVEGNSLADLNPDLAVEWHPNRNDDVTAAEVMPNSNKKAWWLCAEGHEWRANVQSRNVGSGCPYCSGKAVGYGNSLADLRPDLAAQWHPSRNPGLAASQVRPGSNKKAWWVCSEGHAWEAVIASRTKGRGCPVCSGRTAGAGSSLADLSPLLAAQWHPDLNGDQTPSDARPGSERKVWWLCQLGHAWQAAISSRTLGRGCPTCRSPGWSQVAFQIAAELATLFPVGDLEDAPSEVDREIGWEPDIVLPELRIAIDVDGRHWHDDNYYPGSRERDTRKVTRFQEAGWNLVRIRESPLLKLGPHDVVVADLSQTKTTVLDVAKHLQDRFGLAAHGLEEYRARNGLAAQAAADAVIARFQTARLDGRSFGSAHPELRAEWHDERNAPLGPDSLFPNSERLVWWLCALGHEWEAIVARRHDGDGCPYCSGKWAGYGNSLVDVNPVLAAQWHPTRNMPLEPAEVRPGSGKIVWWRCPEGHEWRAQINSRNRGSGCPQCRKPQIPRDVSLADWNPDLAAQWHPTRNGERQASDVRPKSGTKAWWICSQGHEWEAIISGRSNGNGCPYCSGRRVGYGNSLADLNTTLAAEWHPTRNSPLQPSDVRPKSNKRVWWQCERAHEWEAVIQSRTNGRGCPQCAKG